ncbi:hypothetical protein PL75_11450, partial [Neisseria arctica]
LMVVISLLPIGVIQAHVSISQGLWYARSEWFMQQDLLDTLRWARTIADLIFIGGSIGGSRRNCKIKFIRKQKTM